MVNKIIFSLNLPSTRKIFGASYGLKNMMLNDDFHG
jgi:hypothetical protein